MRFYEHYKRSIAKTLTYKLLVLISSGFIIYFYTGKIDQTLEIASTAGIITTILYFIHERLWNHIHWENTNRNNIT